MKFNLKIHNCCAKDKLRPAMEHILFDEDFIIASDAHILAVININDLIILDKEKEVLKSLKGKLLHRKAFLKIWNKEVIPTEKGFDCPSEFFSVNFSTDKSLKYPNWKAVIPNHNDIEKQSLIGLSPELLLNLKQALPFNKKQVVLSIIADNKAITVFNNDPEIKSYGIIMPVIIDEIPKQLHLNRETMLFDHFI